MDATESEARELAEAAREAGWSRPSFARGLYLGRFDLSLIHPHPQGSGEGVDRGEAFLAELRAVCEKLDGQRIEREDRIPDEYVAALADIGTFGIKIPREYGGLGLSMAYYGRALMLVGSVHPSIGALVSAHQSIGVPEPVRMFGTEEQKQRFLPRCAAGAITAFLLTEPDVGSDPARMSSTATPTEFLGSQRWRPSSSRIFSSIVVSSAIAAGASRVLQMTRTRSARLTMPTTMPSRTTGRRLISLRRIRATAFESDTPSSMLTTFGVMTSETRRPCVRTYWPAR